MGSIVSKKAKHVMAEFDVSCEWSICEASGVVFFGVGFFLFCFLRGWWWGGGVVYY